ncbi:EAL domain-containing protein [Stenotrophomonas tuberculopleuritidis]|uniref:EAL domain-containing protein n=1 Tax=Stenotrophomonas tuberculopleuritidis TaxID=3055079 RepID=UPI0026E5264A|nr:EAL domain-containing protein [Stenotrophomonas sp. 704A1]
MLAPDLDRVPLAPEELIRAMDNDELVVLYQPKVECGSRQVVGAEAMVRWQHPQRGLLAPSHFIELAEQAGLIHRLGRWVLNRARSQLREWHNSGNPDWSIGVNISPVQLLHRGFCGQVRDALDRNNIAAEKLTLYVSLSCLMSPINDGCGALSDLFADGVQIALRSFGSELPSLGRLKRLPLNEIKIDRVFVAKVDTDPVDSDIVSAIVTLGAILGVKVVAEGVDRPEQLRAIELLACDQSQGWLHSPCMGGRLFLRRFGSKGSPFIVDDSPAVKEMAFG